MVNVLRSISIEVGHLPVLLLEKKHSKFFRRVANLAILVVSFSGASVFANQQKLISIENLFGNNCSAALTRSADSDISSLILKCRSSPGQSACQKIIERFRPGLTRNSERFYFASKHQVGSRLDVEDFMQAGIVGLLQAVNDLDLEEYIYGGQQVNAIMNGIKWAMYDLAIDNINSTYITGNGYLKRFVLELVRAKKELRSPVIPEKVNDKVTENVKLCVEDVLSRTEIPPSAIQLEDLTLIDLKAELDRERRAEAMASRIIDLVSRLDDRRQDIFYSRIYVAEDAQKSTLAELSKKHGVSVEMIRQVEVSILKRIRKTLTNCTDER